MSIGNSPEDERPEDDSEEDRPSIGRALQQARIAAGLTVDEVSSATRVRIPIVHAIEAGRLLPLRRRRLRPRSHPHARARRRPRPRPLIEQYDAEHGGRPAPTPAAPLFEAERIRPERRGPTGPPPWSPRSSPWSASSASPRSTAATTSDGHRSRRRRLRAADQRHAQQPTPKTDKPERPEARAVRQRHRGASPRTRSPSGHRRATARAGSPPRTTTAGCCSTACSSRASPRPSSDSKQIDLVLGDAGAIELYVNGKKIEDDWRAAARSSG